MEIIVKNNIENQHRKSTLKINIENTTLKINIENRLTKKKTTLFPRGPVVIIDQDALHAYSIYFIFRDVIRSS